jgi:hypothetical protein
MEQRFIRTYSVPSYQETAEWEARYPIAIKRILEGVDEGSAPGDPMPFLMAWPRRRFVELFAARTLELPPVPVSTTHRGLAEALWAAVQAEESGHPRSHQLRQLMVWLTDANLFPVLPEGSVSGDGANWSIMQANVLKVREVNNNVRMVRGIRNLNQRSNYVSIYLAHPAWIGAAVMYPNAYQKVYRTVANVQAPMLRIENTEEDEEEKKEKEEEKTDDMDMGIYML